MIKLALVAAMALVPFSANAAEFLTLTIDDPGRPFTVIDGTCAMNVYPTITLADGFNQTMAGAFKQILALAQKANADALIGMDVSWETPTNTGQKGRVVVCGTLIKFK